MKMSFIVFKSIFAALHLSVFIFCCCGIARVYRLHLHPEWLRAMFCGVGAIPNLFWGLQRIVQLVQGLMGFDLNYIKDKEI